MKPILIAAAAAGATFAIVGPLDAYAGSLRMLMPFLAADTRLKVRSYAVPIGLIVGAGAYLLTR